MSEVLIFLERQSILDVVQPGLELLRECDIPFQLRLVSAYDTPEIVRQMVKDFEESNGKVFIAASEYPGFLPLTVSSWSHLPVIGVISSSTGSKKQGSEENPNLNLPSLTGCAPVAMVGYDIRGFCHASFLAAQILATSDHLLRTKLKRIRARSAAKTQEIDSEFRINFSGLSHKGLVPENKVDDAP